MRDETPLIWPVFQRAMETLIALRGPDLLRIKGLLNLAGSRGPVVFQAVQHLIHPPVELSAWPDKDHASRVVFITRGISERQVRGLVQGVPGAGLFPGISRPRRIFIGRRLFDQPSHLWTSLDSKPRSQLKTSLREAMPP